MKPAKNRSPICLVLATKAEAEKAMQMLQARATDNNENLFAGWHPESAEKIFILLTDMGPEAAYRATSNFLNKQRVSKIINLGVAGSLQDHLQVGDLCTVSSVHMENALDKEGNGWNKITSLPLPNLPKQRLVSVSTPVFDDERKTGLAASADLVDMEGAAIARACCQYKIPCYMLKGITDFAGVDGREILHKNLFDVSHALTDELFQRGDIFAS